MSLAKTILIVDDEADFRELFSDKLADSGYHIETASNGKEGLEKARAIKPDLILLDMKMPGMNGDEVLSEIRKDPAIHATKVVFLTNFGDPRDEGVDAKYAKEVGACGYIRKTVSLSQLSNIVDANLKEKRMHPTE